MEAQSFGDRVASDRLHKHGLADMNRAPRAKCVRYSPPQDQLTGELHATEGRHCICPSWCFTMRVLHCKPKGWRRGSQQRASRGSAICPAAKRSCVPDCSDTNRCGPELTLRSRAIVG